MSFTDRLSSLVLILCATCSFAAEAPSEPHLGQPQFLGALWNSTRSEVELEMVLNPGEHPGLASSLPDVLPEESGNLGKPVLLASLLEPATRTLTIADPTEVQQQLQRASDMLNAIGMTTEARQVETIGRGFEATLLNRLKLEWKRAQWKQLQADIERFEALTNQPLEVLPEEALIEFHDESSVILNVDFSAPEIEVNSPRKSE